MILTEYADEPVRGLPGYLPEGETLVWQGAPDWRVMAKRVFHLRTVAIYFAAIIAVHSGSQLYRGAAPSEVFLGAGWQLGLGLLAMAILAVLARAYARSTVYTLTDKRLVMRFGVALPMMVNLPLEIVTSADLRGFKDGSGDIILTVNPKKRMSYMMLWPNLRPWRFSPVQPALRSLTDARSVASALASVVDSRAQVLSSTAQEHGTPAMAGAG